MLRNLVLICGAFALCLAKKHEVFPQRCEDVHVFPVEYYNFTAYTGKWYGIQHYKHNGLLTGDCQEYQFTETQFVTTNKDLSNGSIQKSTVDMKYADPAIRNGELIETIEELKVTEKVYILGTDYTNFGVAWSCRNNPKNVNTHWEYIWILGRDTKFSQVTRDKVDKVLQYNKIDTKKIISIIQDKRCR